MTHRFRFSLLILVTGVWCCVDVLAQATSTKSFEVASVRALPSDAVPNYDLALLEPFAEGDLRTTLFSTDAGVLELVVFAYQVRDTGLYPKLEASLPSWALKDVFHIQARMPIGSTRDDARLMMQTLLRERFHVQVHTETQVAPALALVASMRTGSLLRPHTPSGKCKDADGSISTSAKDARSSVVEVVCGVSAHMQNGLYTVRMTNLSMNDIAGQLSGLGTYMGRTGKRIIRDATGLQGRFDAELSFTPMPTDPSSAWEGKSLSDAIRDDLGLDMKKADVPVDFVIVDHVEHPSSNDE